MISITRNSFGEFDDALDRWRHMRRQRRPRRQPLRFFGADIADIGRCHLFRLLRRLE